MASLAGHLQHACVIVRRDRTFLSRIFDLMAKVAHPDHFVRLSAGFRLDLMWWKLFLKEWYSLSLMRAVGKQLADVEVFSDASGSWGCGAYSGSQWFQLAWSSGAAKYQIAVKEHLPVVLAVAVWGKDWKGLDVTCHSDNQAVVSVIHSRTSKDPDIMHSLSFIEARYEFFLSTGQRFYAQQHLSILDLAVDNPVNPLKRSKTDQFHKGTCVCIRCTGDGLCPVAAFLAY